MKASRVMTREVRCAAPDLPIEKAWAMMWNLRVRHIPVLSEGRLTGVLSDRDLLTRATRADDGTLSFPPLTCGEVMTISPITAPSTTRVPNLASLMLQHRIDCVPIVDLDGHLWGLVTSSDLIELLTEPGNVSEVLPYTYQLRFGTEP